MPNLHVRPCAAIWLPNGGNEIVSVTPFLRPFDCARRENIVHASLSLSLSAPREIFFFAASSLARSLSSAARPERSALSTCIGTLFAHTWAGATATCTMVGAPDFRVSTHRHCAEPFAAGAGATSEIDRPAMDRR